MLREYLTSIANAIRSKLGSTAKINAQDFSAKIDEVFNEGYLRGIPYGYNQGKEAGIEEGKSLGKLELLQDSEYMNAKVSGTAIAVNDVSPIEHSVGCFVESKNMLDPRIYVDTSNQGTVSILDDGLVELRGALNSGTYAEITYGFITTEPCVLILRPSNEYSEYWSVGVYLNDTVLHHDNNLISVPLSVGTYELRLVQGEQSTSGTYIQLEKGTTATPYTPYIADLSTVEVSRYGKNLFDIDTVLPSFINDYGDVGKWIKQSDGSYFKENVGTGYGDIWFENTANYKGQMVMSVTSKYKRTEVGGYGLGLIIEYTDGTRGNLKTPITLEYSVTVVVTDANKTVSNIWQTYDSGEGMYVKDVMIAYGTNTTYEPYIKPTTYQSNADGTVEGVKSISPNMTLLTNNNNVIINANYLRDIDTYINNLITNVALTGGE